MNAYIYQAALWCEDCARKVCVDLDAAGKKPADVDNESSFDSDDYPKGPYCNGGGEADCPQHCDGCHAFLENELTTDGVRYVAEALIEGFRRGRGDRSVLREWEQFYDVRDELRDMLIEYFEAWLYPNTEAEEKATA